MITELKTVEVAVGLAAIIGAAIKCSHHMALTEAAADPDVPVAAVQCARVIRVGLPCIDASVETGVAPFIGGGQGLLFDDGRVTGSRCGIDTGVIALDLMKPISNPEGACAVGNIKAHLLAGLAGFIGLGFGRAVQGRKSQALRGRRSQQGARAIAVGIGDGVAGAHCRVV